MAEISRYCLGFAFDIPAFVSEGAIAANVALIRKVKPTWQAGRLNGIGGSIESFDVEPIDAMVREFREETGFETSRTAWEHFHTMGGETWQVECFKTFNVPMWELATTTDEEVVIMQAAFMTADVLFNLRWLVPLALDPQPLPVVQSYR